LGILRLRQLIGRIRSNAILISGSTIQKVAREIKKDENLPRLKVWLEKDLLKNRTLDESGYFFPYSLNSVVG
jgi:hypothetical protein